ncbi:hypothetical protein SCP_1400370 [Sparassis crispa]|uniref:Uncharacterized protein n=1 Tax=Sparassis crispa TaxID=139825 RepID=A0A401H2K6_9APHY|nr:hypothetical protein SCP_1400370 [Sparassis crispa]GBE88632.1 hypothetical protein SCP_1400370 [Sparassis crispa]
MDTFTFDIPAILAGDTEPQTNVLVQDIYGPNIADRKPVQLLPYHVQHYNHNMQRWMAVVAAAHDELMRGFQYQINAEAKLREVMLSVDDFCFYNDRSVDLAGECSTFWDPDPEFNQMEDARTAITDKTPPVEWSDSVGLDLSLFQKHAYQMSKHSEALSSLFASFIAVPISLSRDDINESRRTPLYARRDGTATNEIARAMEDVMPSDANNEREARQLKLEPAKWSHVLLGSDFGPRLFNPGTPDRRLYSETSYDFDIQDDDMKGPGCAPSRSLFEILNISEGELYDCSEDELADCYHGHPERPQPRYGSH